jgi:hypothetical protein
VHRYGSAITEPLTNTKIDPMYIDTYMAGRDVGGAPGEWSVGEGPTGGSTRVRQLLYKPETVEDVGVVARVGPVEKSRGRKAQVVRLESQDAGHWSSPIYKRLFHW